MKNYNKKNIIAMVLGVVLIGTGVCLLNLSNLGQDPYSCMNYGISNIIGLSFGTCQLILNIVLFIPIIFMGRKYIGLGSFVNMVGVGYIAQFVGYVFNLFGFVGNKSIMMNLLFLILGVCLLCFGCAMYTKANLGIAPYDALAYVIEECIHEKIKFKWIRIITDIVCVTIGFLTGGTIGVSTIIMMLFTGPLVQFFKDILNPIFIDENSNKGTHKIKRNLVV